MKWTLYPKNKDLTTSLPMSVEIEEWDGTPKVHLKGVGDLHLRKTGTKLRTEFYVALPGTYELTVKDSSHSQSLNLDVKEHRYLDFGNEFGFFLVLFLLTMGGIILWTRKIMTK